jgi:hypothetical protein
MGLLRFCSAGVSLQGNGEIPVTLANEAAIRRALEVAGIQFIEDNGGGEGVRFRKPQVIKKRK